MLRGASQSVVWAGVERPCTHQPQMLQQRPKNSSFTLKDERKSEFASERRRQLLLSCISSDAEVAALI